MPQLAARALRARAWLLAIALAGMGADVPPIDSPAPAPATATPSAQEPTPKPAPIPAPEPAPEAEPAVDTSADAPGEIAYTQFELANGLTVLVHEDHKAPIVAVNVWYHVGSKDERPGHTGFAHLFEHLMFNGSEHYDEDYFTPLEEVGATDMNGTTNSDRTNYFENVPSTALERALWLESDRMGHLLGVMTQAKLDEQRRVVKNEKRQGQNRPYSDALEILGRTVFPAGHPYSWTPIGEMEDLDAASLDDVRAWFSQHYGAANAVLVLAGDVDPEQARELADRYFSEVPPGPPLVRPLAWVPRSISERRVRAEGRVPYPRLYLAWSAPAYATLDADLLDVAANAIGGGRSSRLYRRLVLKDELATSVTASNWRREIAGLFLITIDARPDGDLRAIEKIAREEIAAFLKSGPTPAELARAKTAARASFLRGIERVGGFGGKSDVLAVNAVFAGDPSYYQVVQSNIAGAMPGAVRDAAQRWIASGSTALEYWPAAAHRTEASGVDRSLGIPAVSVLPQPSFPEVERERFGNGLELVIASRPGVPVVELELQFAAGSATDRDGLPGAASFALDMLDEGTQKRDAAAIRERLDQLGAELTVRTELDTSSVLVSALDENLDGTLELLADVVRSPAFRDESIERLREARLAAIQREALEPESLALRALPALVFGEGHPYSGPLSGSGTSESVRALTRGDLVDFQRRWLRPDNATLIAAGPIDHQRLQTLVQRHLGAWRAPEGEIPHLQIPAVKPPAQSRVFLLDRPGAPQSVIIAATLAPPTADADDLALSIAGDALGGSFTSRLNQKLREEKGWAYGASLRRAPAAGPTLLYALAPVQTDRTGDSMREILAQYQAVVGSTPLRDEEVAATVRRRLRELPGRYETNRSVLGALSDLVRFRRPDDWVQNTSARLSAVSPDEVRNAVRRVLRPEQLTWLVVGDLAQIEQPIRALELGPITVLDARAHFSEGE